MKEYRFITVWRIDAPIEAVCAAIYRPTHWPGWWTGVEHVEQLAPGDARGIGSVCRYIWKGRLPYRLTFDIRVSRVVPQAVIEGIASGEVEGFGRWLFCREGSLTVVRYEWHVRTTPLWMNLLAPLASPIFKWNHDYLMRQGGEGLARLLNARLVGIGNG